MQLSPLFGVSAGPRGDISVGAAQKLVNAQDRDSTRVAARRGGFTGSVPNNGAGGADDDHPVAVAEQLA